MDPKQELEQLRKMKRLRELEAKAGVASQPLQTTPDAADKAANPKQPTVEQMAAAGAKVGMDKITPKMRKAFEDYDRNLPGALAGAIPVAGVPKMLAYLFKQGIGPTLARLGINTGLSAGAEALATPEDRAGGALTGAIKGLGMGMLGEGVGALAGAGRDLYKTSRFALDPVRAQDTAKESLFSATDKLRASEAQNLANSLQGKKMSIDTTELSGIHPEIDATLGKYKDAYGGLPSRVDMDAMEGHNIRSKLDQQMSYKQKGPFAQTAETLASDARLKKLADPLRAQEHALSPQTSDILDQWSENLNIAGGLDRRANRAPMGALTSGSGDQQALLQRVDQTIGSDLSTLGAQLANAEKLKTFTGAVPAVLRSGLRGASQGSPGLSLGLEGLGQLGNAASLSGLFDSEKKK